MSLTTDPAMLYLLRPSGPELLGYLPRAGAVMKRPTFTFAILPGSLRAGLRERLLHEAPHRYRAELQA